MNKRQVKALCVAQAKTKLGSEPWVFCKWSQDFKKENVVRVFCGALKAQEKDYNWIDMGRAFEAAWKIMTKEERDDCARYVLAKRLTV